MDSFKLYMILLGCKPKGRNTEQHDVFFGIGKTLEELFPELINFWPEAKGKVHIDAWREINFVDGYKIEVAIKDSNADPVQSGERLFFINLGGYQEFKLEEQHYFVLTVKPNKELAVREAKNCVFFQNNQVDHARSHVDEKYGIDVDDIYQIEDILNSSCKNKYAIAVSRQEGLKTDAINLGYVKLW